MSVAYASPNRSHHFKYAEGLFAEGLLTAFIQGYPRLNRAQLDVDHDKIAHRDVLQTLFIPLFRVCNEHPLTHRINLASKNNIDRGLREAMQRASIGLFYNGCGLHAIEYWRKRSPEKIFVCEAVNCHLDIQSEILRDECQRLGLHFKEPYQPEREKRLAEYDASDYILCPSQFVANSFRQKGVPDAKLLINPFGLTKPVTGSEPFEPQPEKDRCKYRILYVGSIHYRKGVRYLIEAFRQLDVCEKELWIVGPTLEPDGIADLSIPEGVQFKGVLKGEALAEAYRSADVFVQPSIEEGLSLVIGEALGFGLPVIATNHTGAEEIFSDGECGFIVPIRDSDAIFASLLKLHQNPDHRHHYSKTALEKSRDFGGWKRSQSGLCALMRQILTAG